MKSCWNPNEEMQIILEIWKRTFEWRPTKYPLKDYWCKKLWMPYKIVESTFHSHLDEMEDGRSINWRSELIHKLILSYRTWKDVKTNSNFSRLFGNRWFNSVALKDVLQTGEHEFGILFLFSPSTILSIDFEGA